MSKLSVKPKYDAVDVLHIYEDRSRMVVNDVPVEDALRDLGENFYIDKREKEFDLVPAMGGSRKYRSQDFEIEGKLLSEDEAFWREAERMKYGKYDPTDKEKALKVHLRKLANEILALDKWLTTEEG